MNLYLDIETGPNPNKTPADYADQVKAPGSYKKPESIQKWMDENAEMEMEKHHRSTSLNPAEGRIIAIGRAWDTDEVVINEPEDEKKILIEFFAEIAEENPVFIGHNIKGFDLDFIIKRSMILGVKPPESFQQARSHRYSPLVYDTMEQWAGWGKFISQDALASAFGLETESIMSGAEVYDYVQAGKMEDILIYCASDVKLVREIYKRMNWM